MAESTLTLAWIDFKKEVGFLLGYGSDPDEWGATRTATIEGIVQTGYRRVLYPQAVQGTVGYEWSFLRPSTTLAIIADDGDYDLPDDFGRLVGDFHYASDKHQAHILRVPLATILEMRSASDQNAYPRYCAIRFKASTGASGQRQEVLFYPEPDTAYTLHYSYDAYQGAMSDTYPYPLGGMQMSELYKESCLAVAESRNADEIGLHAQQYERLLIDAVARDRKRGAQNFGRMGQPSDGGREAFRRGSELYDGAYSITYKGAYL